jgi:chemotaxis protein CheC
MAKRSNYIIIFETSLRSDSNVEIFLALLPEPSLLEDIARMMEQL